MAPNFPHAAKEMLLEKTLATVVRFLGLPGPSGNEPLPDRKSELTDAKAVVLRADCVALVPAVQEFYVIGEIQSHKDKAKPAAWTSYVAFLMRKRDCPVELVVITSSIEVEEWAQQPIPFTSRGSWTPWVLGPSTVPKFLTPEEVKGNPWWGLLCAMVHANQTYAEPLYTTTLHAGMDVYEAGGFKADEFHEFFDTIWEAVTTKWRQRMMEADMRTRTILGEWKAEILEQGLEKGLEKGLEQGLRNSIQRVCETRGLILERAHHDFLAECHDLHRLESLLDRAATAHDVKEVFKS